MKAILLTLVLAVAACDHNRVVTNQVLVDRPHMQVPNITPVQQLPMEWRAITRDTIDIKFREAEQNGSNVLFAITPQGYQNLSINVAELRRYILQQQAVIVALREYYESPQGQQDVQRQQRQ